MSIVCELYDELFHFILHSSKIYCSLSIISASTFPYRYFTVNLYGVQ